MELFNHVFLMKAILSVNDVASQNNKHYELVSQNLLTEGILGLVRWVNQSSENYEVISQTVDESQ